MSQRDSGYERKERDLYETPAWVTEALLPHMRLCQTIWEPAAGPGKMVQVLGRVAQVTATDAIVTNPPYELATEFIERALSFQRPVEGVVAMLLRTDFDHAKTRANLFAGCAVFAKKIVLTKRIKWFEDSKGQPSFNHAWFVWDWKHSGPPILAYGP
jgi:hypothetical protein